MEVLALPGRQEERAPTLPAMTLPSSVVLLTSRQACFTMPTFALFRALAGVIRSPAGRRHGASDVPRRVLTARSGTARSLVGDWARRFFAAAWLV